MQDFLKGDATVMIEWSWRIEGPHSVLLGSWSGDRKITNGVRRLRGRIPELVIQLSGGLWVHSFSTYEGQQQWVLFFGEGDWCHVARGRLERQRWRE